MEETRVCQRCQKTKAISEYDISKRHPRQMLQTCRNCCETVANNYKKNRNKNIERAQRSNKRKSREEINAYRKEFNRRLPAATMLEHARRRARKEKIPFSITFEDIHLPEYCPILGVRLRVNDKKVGPDSFSLDRIDPTLGYVKGNVQVISHKANTMKSNATLEELKMLVNFIEGQQKKVSEKQN